jgi:hypothetical protein
MTKSEFDKKPKALIDEVHKLEDKYEEFQKSS